MPYKPVDNLYIYRYVVDGQAGVFYIAARSFENALAGAQHFNVGHEINILSKLGKLTLMETE